MELESQRHLVGPPAALTWLARVIDGTLRRRRRIFAVTVASLLAVQIVPLWLFRYFPSQDGPSHLYNAAVLAHYQQVPVYREFYTVHLSLGGNFLAQLLLWGLLKAAGEFAAEKILLTIYCMLLPAAFWCLLSAISKQGRALAIFGFLLAPNYFLYMGFWNFCLSIPLALLGIACYFRYQGRWRVGSTLCLAVLALLTYTAHLLSWAVLALVVILDTAVDGAAAWRARRLRAWASGSAAGLVAAVLPGIPALAYLRASKGMEGLHEGWRARAWPLYSLSFFRGLSAADRLVASGFIVVLALLAILAAVHRWRHRRVQAMDVFLLFAASCAALSFFGPAGIASGAFVRDRLALYAWMFAIVWLCVKRWPRAIAAATFASVSALALFGAVARLPAEAKWSRKLSEYAEARRLVQPGSTILAIQIETLAPAIDPMYHAVGLVGMNGSIDLRNYEATVPYFSTAFRRARSPSNALGSPYEMDVCDLERYEEATGTQVDYLLVYGGSGLPELSRYPGEFAKYQPVWVSRPNRCARLYRRRKA
jgi:hypothetical protein